MALAAITEAEKKQLGLAVGNDLAARFGKKQYYSQSEVEESASRNGCGVDVACWAYSLFMSHEDFDRYHESIGQSCDYVSMKQSMVASVTDHASDGWVDFDVDLSWLEWPDLSSVFDIF